MGNKVGRQYAISTEEFCAIDYLSKKRFLLKETRPEVSARINEMWDRATQIEEINDVYPETFINNSRRDIFNDSNLPEFIPVEVLRDLKNNCYLCKELLFHRYKFVIPDSVLTRHFEFMDMIDLDLFLNAQDITSIKACMDLFFSELNPPQTVKRRIKKGTK